MKFGGSYRFILTTYQSKVEDIVGSNLSKFDKKLSEFLLLSVIVVEIVQDGSSNQLVQNLKKNVQSKRFNNNEPISSSMLIIDQ
jgi:GT2 family glycosyltransferase